MPEYLVGIDLGTTNSALAFIQARRTAADAGFPIQNFHVPQLVAPAAIRDLPLLPSFLYLPGPHELPAGAAALPWNACASDIVGDFARTQGARVPGRMVSSAKSWLCHSAVDRSAPVLPWGAPADVERVSPVDVSARYLRHLVDAWNYVTSRPEARLQDQSIVLTVPASFDDVARALTVEAAGRAGLERITLLEEPQAAFYCWLAARPSVETSALRAGDVCLVIDVGGGTTDFSLIQAVERKGELAFDRLAVGDHLLLGGDNMDLALAKLVESRLSGTARLDAVQFAGLTQACRAAKEALLDPEGPATQPVTIMGRGRRVIGEAARAMVSREDAIQALIEGFFPMVSSSTGPQPGPRQGLHEMGLPFVSDPAVTRHLAAFLQRHRDVAPCPPCAILFNGGVFEAKLLRDRMLEVLHRWHDAPVGPGARSF